jgi:hypothetical protein
VLTRINTERNGILHRKSNDLVLTRMVSTFNGNLGIKKKGRC